MTAGLSLKCQGLRFMGMEVPIDERSSLDVFSQHSPVFKDSLAVSFSFCKYPPSEFGYILRIKDKNSSTVWNLSYDGIGEDIAIRLNEEGHNSLIKAILPHSDIPHLQWVDMSIKFYFKRDSVSLSIGQRNYSVITELPDDPVKANILFGKSDYFIDVPSFAIRDLHIKGSSLSKDIAFSFDESSGCKAYDRTGFLISKTENPVWLLSESLSWQKVNEIIIQGNSGCAFNPKRKEIYAYNERQIYSLDIIDGSISKKDFKSPCPVRINLGSSFIDPSGDYLYSYETFNLWDEQTTTMTAKLDLDTRIWQDVNDEQLPMPMYHHCSFTDPSTGRYTLFGGFGNSLYNGKFYSIGQDGKWLNIWENLSGDRVYPRYFASAGVDKSAGLVYIYGGMGNESGEQIVGRQYFYDLHSINPVSGESALLWNLDMKDEKIVPVAEMIVQNGCFYTLCYPEYLSKSSLSLYRFNIATGEYEKHGDALQMDSDRMHTHADIYYDDDIQKFYALTYEATSGNGSGDNKLSVYSLSYPPINKSDIKVRINNRLLLELGVFLIFGSAIAGLYLLSRKRRKSRDPEPVESPMASLEKKHFRQPEKSNALYLFGPFLAIDRNGRDISYMFSAQLRQLFCLLMQYKDKEGISSKRLSHIMWPDKDENKVKNSRGVCINHLRKALAQFDGVELIYEDGRYRLDTTNPFYCDYLESQKPDADILGIASRGRFLKHETDDILDEFKSSVEQRIIPELQDKMKIMFESGKYPEAIEISGMLLDIDSLDELALTYQIKSYRKLHLVQEALVKYSEFAAEYKRVSGAEFTKTI